MVLFLADPSDQLGDWNRANLDIFFDHPHSSLTFKLGGMGVNAFDDLDDAGGWGSKIWENLMI